MHHTRQVSILPRIFLQEFRSIREKLPEKFLEILDDSNGDGCFHEDHPIDGRDRESCCTREKCRGAWRRTGFKDAFRENVIRIGTFFEKKIPTRFCSPMWRVSRLSARFLNADSRCLECRMKFFLLARSPAFSSTRTYFDKWSLCA